MHWAGMIATLCKTLMAILDQWLKQAMVLNINVLCFNSMALSVSFQQLQNSVGLNGQLNTSVPLSQTLFTAWWMAWFYSGMEAREHNGAYTMTPPRIHTKFKTGHGTWEILRIWPAFKFRPYPMVQSPTTTCLYPGMCSWRITSLQPYIKTRTLHRVKSQALSPAHIFLLSEGIKT